MAPVVRGDRPGRRGGQAAVVAVSVRGARDAQSEAGANGRLRGAGVPMGEGPQGRSGGFVAARPVRTGRRALAGRVLLGVHARGPTGAGEEARTVPGGPVGGASTGPGHDEPVGARQGPLLREAPAGAGVRGGVRPGDGAPDPPRVEVPPVAAGQAGRAVHVRPVDPAGEPGPARDVGVAETGGGTPPPYLLASPRMAPPRPAGRGAPHSRTATDDKGRRPWPSPFSSTSSPTTSRRPGTTSSRPWRPRGCRPSRPCIPAPISRWGRRTWRPCSPRRSSCRRSRRTHGSTSPARSWTSTGCG